MSCGCPHPVPMGCHHLGCVMSPPCGGGGGGQGGVPLPSVGNTVTSFLCIAWSWQKVRDISGDTLGCSRGRVSVGALGFFGGQEEGAQLVLAHQGCGAGLVGLCPAVRALGAHCDAGSHGPALCSLCCSPSSSWRMAMAPHPAGPVGSGPPAPAAGQFLVPRRARSPSPARYGAGGGEEDPAMCWRGSECFPVVLYSSNPPCTG